MNNSIAKSQLPLPESTDRFVIFNAHSLSIMNLSLNICIFFCIKDDVDARRESLIKGLCIYLNENPDILVHEYMVSVISRLLICCILKCIWCTLILKAIVKLNILHLS